MLFVSAHHTARPLPELTAVCVSLTATYVISVTPRDSPLSPPVIYRIHEAENI